MSSSKASNIGELYGGVQRTVPVIPSSISVILNAVKDLPTFAAILDIVTLNTMGVILRKAKGNTQQEGFDERRSSN